MIVVGIDPSLTSTGVAVIDTESGEISAVRIATKASGDDLANRSRRIDAIANVVLDTVLFCDVAAVEGPSYAQRHAGSAHDRSGLWWAITGSLVGYGSPVVEVPPTVRAKYATGKGNAPKDAVMLAAAKRYPGADIDGNDTADAVILAAIGARLAGHPIDDPMPATHLAALTKLRWPG